MVASFRSELTPPCNPIKATNKDYTGENNNKIPTVFVKQRAPGVLVLAVLIKTKNVWKKNDGVEAPSNNAVFVEEATPLSSN